MMIKDMYEQALRDGNFLVGVPRARTTERSAPHVRYSQMAAGA